MVKPLIPFLTWSIGFGSYFLRNVMRYLQVDDQDPSKQALELLGGQSYPQYFFIYNAKSLPHLQPCVSDFHSKEPVTTHERSDITLV